MLTNEAIGTAMVAGCVAMVWAKRWPVDLVTVVLQHIQAGVLWAWYEVPGAVRSRAGRYREWLDYVQTGRRYRV